MNLKGLCFSCKEKPRVSFAHCADCLSKHNNAMRTQIQKFPKLNVTKEFREWALAAYPQCAICRRYFDDKIVKPVIDHSHKNNQLRGVLCRQCNSGLGMLQDNPNNLWRAMLYLWQFKTPDSKLRRRIREWLN